MNLNKDCVGLLLAHLSPRDALAFGATNKYYYHAVSNSQIYWYYQFKGFLGRNRSQDEEAQKIAGKRMVHIKPFTRNCLRSMWKCQHVFNTIVEKRPELRSQIDYEMTPEKKDTFFRIRYPGVLNPPNNPYLENMFKEECMKKVLEPHLKEIGNLPNITCNVQGHCVMIHDANPVIGHQKEAQSNDEGLYMYHYLFVCFHNRKKEIAKKMPQEEREYIMDQLRKQIRLEEEKLMELKNRLSHHEHHQKLKDKAKECPFQRKNPSTYHETREAKKRKTK